MRGPLPCSAILADHLGQYAGNKLEAATELAGCADATVVISTVDPRYLFNRCPALSRVQPLDLVFDRSIRYLTEDRMLKRTLKSILNMLGLDLHAARRAVSKAERLLRKAVTTALRLVRYMGLAEPSADGLFIRCACPVCRSQSARYLFSQKESFSYSGIDKDYIFDLVQCVHCSMTYVNPRLKEDVALEIYRQDLIETCKHGDAHDETKGALFDAYHARIDERKEHFSGIVDAISRKISHGRMLEIGSSFGYFVQQCQEGGYQAYGIEPSRGCASFAREALGLRNIASATWEDDPFPILFDVVCMLSVIEHLYHPVACLRYVDSRLKAGGYLFLSCPILKGELLWHDAHPVEHVSYFTEESLRRIVKDTLGYEFVELLDNELFVYRKPGTDQGPDVVDRFDESWEG